MLARRAADSVGALWRPAGAKAAARMIGYGAIPLIAAICVFRSALDAYFAGDDFTHLAEVANQGLPAVLFRPFMGHLYVVPTLDYYLLWRSVGPEPQVFHGIVLVLHLLNVALLFRFVHTLTGSLSLAAWGALLWGTSPYHSEALGWFCVHGHVLAGSGFLLAITGLATALRTDRSIGGGRAAVWAALLFVAATCFGTAIAPVLLFPGVVFLLARRQGTVTRGAAAVLLLLPIAFLTAYWVLNRLNQPDSATARVQIASNSRTFITDLAPTYVGFGSNAPQLVVETWGHLLTFGPAGLCTGFLHWPLSYPSAGAFAIAVVLVGALTVAVVRNRLGMRGWLLGLLVISVACYALVALGRGAVSALVFQVPTWWTATVPRYHYLPSIALAAVLCLVLDEWADLFRLGRGVRRILLPAFLACWSVAFARSDWTIGGHELSRKATEEVFDRARTAVARGSTDAMCIPDQPFVAADVLPTPLVWGPLTHAGVFSIFSTTDQAPGRRIRYLQGNEVFLASVPSNSRLAHLMMSPGNAPECAHPRGG